MKRFWNIVSIILICGFISTPQIDARGRNNNNNNGTSQSNQPARTSGSSSNATRPNSNNNTPKPGGNNNNTPKPGSNNNNTPKPGGNNNNAPKPGSNNNNAPKPGGNNNNAPKPGSNNNNTPKPGGNNNTHHEKINRPHCPPTTPYHRPTPPPTSYRPNKNAPSFRTIFGITFGSNISISLDFLNRNSYNINGYGNDVIYLRNVTEYGYMWPDATLYFGYNGLEGTQLMYSTNHNDHSRYNMVYGSLVAQYGNPINIEYVSNGMIATWWGHDGKYVSLEYRPVYTNNGQLRYITTLSFGI